MNARRRCTFLVASLVLAPGRVAEAGMPAVTLADVARMRVQTISFFLVLFLIASWVVQKIWNSLSTDFPQLPRLSYRRALGLVAMWGLLFLLVLTMISGARELMTPGAWKKDGLTYKLAEAKPPEFENETPRIQGLDRLRIALWTYARGHGGLFPPEDRLPEIPDEAWRVPDPSGMRYVYARGKTADQGHSPLAYEPDLFGGDRFVLFTDGQIRRASSEELRRTLAEGGR